MSECVEGELGTYNAHMLYIPTVHIQRHVYIFL